MVARGTVEHIPPLSMSFWRWVLALAIILPFGLPGIWRHRQVIRQRLGSMIALATFSVAAFNSLLYVAAMTTTATNIALINATIPIFVALLAWLLLGDRTRPIQILGIAMALAGILCVIARGDVSVLTGLQAQPGDLVMVAAVFSWGGLFSVLLRRQAVPLPALTFLTTQILLGTLILAPVYLLDFLFFSGGFALSQSTALPLIYFAIFPGILAYAFWNHAYTVLALPGCHFHVPYAGLCLCACGGFPRGGKPQPVSSGGWTADTRRPDTGDPNRPASVPPACHCTG